MHLYLSCHGNVHFSLQWSVMERPELLESDRPAYQLWFHHTGRAGNLPSLKLFPVYKIYFAKLLSILAI